MVSAVDSKYKARLLQRSARINAQQCGEYNQIYACELMVDVCQTEAVQRKYGRLKFSGKLREISLWAPKATC